jgi:hypothetical protein
MMRFADVVVFTLEIAFSLLRCSPRTRARPDPGSLLKEKDLLVIQKIGECSENLEIDPLAPSQECAKGMVLLGIKRLLRRE